MPWDQVEEHMGEAYTVMCHWFNDYGYEADIAALREKHPGLVSFEQYLRGTAGRMPGLPQRATSEVRLQWIPACAGMTLMVGARSCALQRGTPRSTGAARSCTMGV
jgi:hypothetical protein